MMKQNLNQTISKYVGRWPQFRARIVRAGSRSFVLMVLWLCVLVAPAYADSCPLVGGYGLSNQKITPSTSVTIGQSITVSATLCLSTVYNHDSWYGAVLTNTITGESFTLKKSDMTLKDNHLSGTFRTSGIRGGQGATGDHLRIEISAWQTYCCAGLHYGCEEVCSTFNDKKSFDLTLYPLPVGRLVANIELGRTLNDLDAQTRCPSVCAQYGQWDGKWKTTVPGAMTVCECSISAPWTADIEAGPIWSNSDAQGKCSSACAPYGQWNGNWKTTVPNAMSVCGCNISVDRLGWSKKDLDNSRGYCEYSASQKQCLTISIIGGKNCWKCDDEDRDHLDMNTEDLNFVTELKPGVQTLSDGRYIYVFRGWDNKLLIRPYDRKDSNGTCNTLYGRYQYPGNQRGSDYLHVRHSQLDNGWDPLWAAGELKIWRGKVVAINNESGHFKPSAANVDYVVNTMRAWRIPLDQNVKWGDRGTVSATLSSSECSSILHDELRK